MADKLHRLAGENQFAFKQKTNTLHASIAFHDFVTRTLDNPESYGVIVLSFDLRRAFDSLSHQALLTTLRGGNLPTGFIIWVSSFLKDRFFRISLDSIAYSTFHKMTSGVPQGSVLAPLLFFAHMGSLEPVESHTQMLKYADDVLVSIPVFNLSNQDQIILSEIMNISHWSDTHGLSLNTEKTKSMFIRKGNSPSNLKISSDDIKIVSVFKFLGMVFNEAFNWDSLRRLKEAGFSKPNLISVYNAFIRSTLEYNSPFMIGLNNKNSKKFQKLERQCHRIICGNECRNNCIGSLQDRRKIRALKVFNELLESKSCLHHLIPRRLPYSGHLEMPFCRTYRRAQSFIPSGVSLFNSS